MKSHRMVSSCPTPGESGQTSQSRRLPFMWRSWSLTLFVESAELFEADNVMTKHVPTHGPCRRRHLHVAIVAWWHQGAGWKCAVLQYVMTCYDIV